MGLPSRSAKRISSAMALMLTATLVSGCHTMTPIVVRPSTLPTPTAATFAQLRVNDTVRVTLQNTDIAEFRVSKVQPDALIASDGQQFLYSDITRVEKRRVSIEKSFLLGCAIWGLLGVLAAFTMGG